MVIKSDEVLAKELPRPQDGSQRLRPPDATEAPKLTRSEQKEKRKLPTDGEYIDREIESVDEDQFGFRDYAGVLVRRVLQAGTPLTIGIFGSWGSGKSSLMKLLKVELEKEENNNRRVKTLWLNVWELRNQDEVWHAFLQALFSEVERKLPFWRRLDIRKLIIHLAINSGRVLLVITPMIVGVLLSKPDTDWGNVLSLILNPIAGVGTLVTAGLGLWTLVKPILAAAREVVHFDLQTVLKYVPYEAQISELRRLREQFEKLVKVLVGAEGRLIVFIDDLDRCTPDEVPGVLEAIKLFTSTRGCVYVLGLDHNIVRQGIKQKYNFKTEDEATEYLEKLVQIPFQLPPLDKTHIKNFIQKCYSSLHECCSTAAEIFAEGLEPNPRKIKRALNIYRTLLALAEVRLRAWEMDPVDDELVAKMVVIQSHFRALHEYLVRHPTFLLKVEEKALTDEGLVDNEALRKDEEVGWILLGKPEKIDKVEPSLIEESKLKALNDLLRAGNKHFNDEDQRNQNSSYIYLTATAEGGVTGVRPSRKERDALLGGNPEEIEKQVNEILIRANGDEEKELAVTRDYIERLEGVLSNAQYSASERESALKAFVLLERWDRKVGEILLGGDLTEAINSIHDRDSEPEVQKRITNAYIEGFEAVLWDLLERYRVAENGFPQHIQQIATEVFPKELKLNPRMFKQAVNSYQALLRLAANRNNAWGMAPVDEELLAKMVVIKFHFQVLHEYLVRHPTFLLKVEEKALTGEGLVDNEALRKDEEVGWILLGKSYSIGEAEPGLIEENSLIALNDLLRAGKGRFNDAQRDQISLYIYLTAIRESSSAAIDRLEGWKQGVFDPEMVRVSAGPFLMGSSDEETDVSDNEKPQHTVQLGAYRIGRYPVTNAEYERFVEAGGYQEKRWWTEVGWQWKEEGNRTEPEFWQNAGFNQPNQPVVGVSWYECVAYCRWLSEQTGKTYRLPTEAEWEKAARGTDGRIYPWGNEWDETKLNTQENGSGKITLGGQYSPDGDSPYGAADMAGNIWEWCATKWKKAYPYDVEFEDEWTEAYLQGDYDRAWRGGSYLNKRKDARCTFRNRFDPKFRGRNFGFRVVASPPLAPESVSENSPQRHQGIQKLYKNLSALVPLWLKKRIFQTDSEGTGAVIDEAGSSVIEEVAFPSSTLEETTAMMAYSVTASYAYPMDEHGPHCYCFSVLGNDTTLYTKKQTLSAPTPIRRQAFEERKTDYYGEGKSIHIWQGISRGSWQSISPENIVVADLTDWQYQPYRGQVAIDPELGRFVFNHDEVPRHNVLVSYHYGFSADIGGGEYNRSLSQPAEPTLYHVGRGEAMERIKQALYQWKEDKPDNAVIEITDSGVYVEQINIELKENQSLQLRAANGARPVISLLDLQTAKRDSLRVQGTPGARFILDGLLVTGREVYVEGKLDEVIIRHSTLVPGWSLQPNCEPRRPIEPSLQLMDTEARVMIEHSVIGSIQVNQDEVGTDPIPIHLSDSILDATSPDLEALVPGWSEPRAHAVLTIVRSTVFGDIDAYAIDMAENSIFIGRIKVANHERGYMRFCYVSPDSHTPPRYHCQPDLVNKAIAAKFESEEERERAREREHLRVRPQFDSTRYGTPSYCKLAHNSAKEIKCGADDEAELGVFHDPY